MIRWVQPGWRILPSVRKQLGELDLNAHYGPQPAWMNKELQLMFTLAPHALRLRVTVHDELRQAITGAYRDPLAPADE